MADPSPRRRPWTTWALVASLGLNLAMLGLLTGAVLRGPPPAPGPGLWHYARALPDPYRHDLGRALEDSRHDWTGPREAMRSQRAALAAALTAEPFDLHAVEAVLDSQAKLAGELTARGSRLIAAQVVRMSPAERSAYAEALLRDRDRHRRSRHR